MLRSFVPLWHSALARLPLQNCRASCNVSLASLWRVCFGEGLLRLRTHFSFPFILVLFFRGIRYLRLLKVLIAYHLCPA